MPRASSEHELPRPSLWRFRISHLFLVTLGVALGLWVWRLRGQPPIGLNVARSYYSPGWGLVDAPIGLGFSDLGNLLVPFAFWMTLGLLRAVALQVRRRKDGSPVREEGAVPTRLVLLGRIVLAVCLVLFVALTIDSNTRELESARMRGIYEIREAWLAQSAAMLFLGLLLAHSATGPIRRQRTRSRGLAGLIFPGEACPSWVRGLRLLLLGGFVLAVLSEEMIIPYLGIVAVLGLTLARSPADLPMERVDATFGARFAASLPALVATVAVALVCVGWTVHVTRRSRRSSTAPGAGSWSLYGVGILLLVAAVMNLVFRTVPYLSRFLAESLSSLLDPVNIAIGGVGAAGLSFGLAARVTLRPTAARSSPPESLRGAPGAREQNGALWWLVRLAAVTAIAAAVAASVYYVRSGHVIAVRWPIVDRASAWAEFIGMGALFVLLWLQPSLWALGLTIMAVKLLIHRHRSARGHVAGVAGRRSTESLPLLWMWWPLITLLLVTAVPVAGLAGLLAFHGTVALGW